MYTVKDTKTNRIHAQFGIDHYQRHFKRDVIDKAGKVIKYHGIYDAAGKANAKGIVQHKFGASANFDPGVQTVKWFTYNTKKSNRTRLEAIVLAFEWRQKAREQIMEINANLFNAWKGLPTTNQFPKSLEVTKDGMVSVPIEDWLNYKELLKNQLDRIGQMK
jgi:hypothetical protein